MSLTLDDLSAMSFEALEALYRSGSVPADLAVLDNKPKGRMLCRARSRQDAVVRRCSARFEAAGLSLGR